MFVVEPKNEKLSWLLIIEIINIRYTFGMITLLDNSDVPPRNKSVIFIFVLDPFCQLDMHNNSEDSNLCSWPHLKNSNEKRPSSSHHVCRMLSHPSLAKFPVMHFQIRSHLITFASFPFLIPFDPFNPFQKCG